MSYRLDVPFVSQLNIGGHVKGAATWNDYTGCWYASACMIGYFFEAGPRRGLPENFNQWDPGAMNGKGHGYHQAIGPDGFKKLAQGEGLSSVPKCESVTHAFAIDEIETALQTLGPILFGWHKVTPKSAYGHVSCIFGTQDQNVLYHDPEIDTKGAGSAVSIAQFNINRPGYCRFAFSMSGRSNADPLYIRSKSSAR